MKTLLHGLVALTTLLLLPGPGARAAQDRSDERREAEPRTEHRAVEQRMADLSIPAISSDCACTGELASFDVLAARSVNVVVYNPSSHRIPVEVTLEFTQYQYSAGAPFYRTVTREATLTPHSHTNVRFIGSPTMIRRVNGLSATVRIKGSDVRESNPGNDRYHTNACDPPYAY
jgi:hypothetical protein